MFRHSADLGEEVVFDLPAGHRGDLDQPAGVLGAGRQADLEDAAQGLGQALTTAARLIGGGGQFLGEERVPVGTPGDRIDERRGRRRAGDAGQQLDQLAALEPRQIDAIDARLALGLGQPRGQWMAAMQFVAAEGRDHEQSLVARIARQEGEQVAGRTVGPVQVLDDEHDRGRLAEPAEQPQRALEDAGLEPFGLARRGDLAGAPATPRGRASRARAGSVRRPRRSRSGSTWRASDRRASTIGPNGSPSSPSATAPPSMTSQSRSRRLADGLSDQAALADPGLSPDEDEAGWPSAAESAVERSV